MSHATHLVMGEAVANPLLARGQKCVLVVVDDGTLAELLVESLLEAGHVPQVAAFTDVIESALECVRFDAVIVDLDTWAREGIRVIDKIRQASPSTTVIALLPCGGMSSELEQVSYHLAIEKPARLKAVLTAVGASRVRPGQDG